MDIVSLPRVNPSVFDRLLKSHRYDRDAYEKNLVALKRVLDRNGVPFFLGFGTLLGACREGDFIENDQDVDVLVMERDEDRLVGALSSHEFSESGLSLVRTHQEYLVSVSLGTGYVDVYVFRPDGKFSKCWQYSIETERLENPEKRIFLGLEYLVPRDPESYLSEKYGDWKTKSEKHASS